MTTRRIFAFVATVLVAGGALAFCPLPDDPAAGPPATKGMPHVEAPDGDFRGEVKERIGAGSYTYLDVATAEGRREWVVTLGKGAAVGSQVEIVNMGVRHDFQSRRLARTFERLVFAIVRTRG